MSFNLESLFQDNTGYVEEMFAKYQANPTSVGLEWKSYFDGFEEGFVVASRLAQNSGAYQQLLQDLGTKQAVPSLSPSLSSGPSSPLDVQVCQLVQAWKSLGHRVAQTNPLFQNKLVLNELDPQTYGIGEKDLDTQTQAAISLGFPTLTIRSLVEKCAQRFAGTVGAEIEHVENPVERAWLHEQFATIHDPLPKGVQLDIYKELAKTDAFEKTLAIKYVGKKRFSIEGADAQIPACESFLEESACLGVEECTVAIAHRGRLNFLVHVIQKPFQNLFAEWEGFPHEGLVGDCDVKYHYGYESVRTTRSGKTMRVSMPFNPSHLEIVGPVVMGDTRARQTRYHNSQKAKVASLVFHGDAAVAAQGCVFETAQMMSLEGYSVGGTVHVVANNQIGFTTEPQEARSSTYCTDVAKVTGSPVFHVNGDDVEGLHRVMVLAARYREKFKRDLYVDLICYRRHGHNEGDEPVFTQPLLYQLIKEKKAPYEEYMDSLVQSKGFDEQTLKDIYSRFRNQMGAVYDEVKKTQFPITQFIPLRDAGNLRFVGEQEILEKHRSPMSVEKLKALADKITDVPTSFHVQSKLARIIVAERKEMAKQNKKCDWGMAELLAYASLLEEGFDLRLVGEDSQRGTFSHRHAVLVDAENGDRWNCLSAVHPQSKAEVVNTHLSEEAALAFEYGYAVVHPQSLTIWEAQYGDFVNGAQVVFDQFISSGETKWRQSAGLVLYLPHGLEATGPEHSSCRYERVLQLAADGNLQMCCVTSAAQLFHLLRRQQQRPFRKPLILASPKGFLRNLKVSSTLEELATGSFCEILDDEAIQKPEKVERVLFCTGKIALELIEALEKEEFSKHAGKAAIVRVEQIYPLDVQGILNVVSKYKNAKFFAWVQEEPSNMGSWSFIQEKFAEIPFPEKSKGKFSLHYVGRRRRSSPAVGLEKIHHIEQDKIVRQSFESLNSCFV